MSKYISIVLFFFLYIGVGAQQPADKLVAWAQTNPIEKIYLHCDRDEYVAGQTIWFKSYGYGEFLPFDKSSNLYVELLNKKGTIIRRNVSPIIVSVSRGQLDLPDTLSSGQYLLRAYTATMLNQPDFIFQRSVSVIGRDHGNTVTTSPVTGKTRMEFFPEGGSFVAGLANTVAFKLTTEDGLPVNKNGVIKNSANEVVAEFTSYHDGMGMIDLTPRAGETYTASFTNDTSSQTIALPAASTKGVVFKLLNGDDGIHFELLQQKGDPVFQGAYLVGQMQHHIVFRQQLQAGVTALSGVIKTNTLSSGILQITVFNKEGMPLAERLSFVDNKEYLVKASLVTDTVNMSVKGKNHFTLAFSDTVKGNFSVAVTDPAYSTKLFRDQHIISNLLLTSDLKGQVYNPAYYFSGTGDSAKYALDLLMMVNGWRRFTWTQLMSNTMPLTHHKDAGYININGQVLLEGTKKPLGDKDFMMMVIGSDSSKTVQMIHTNANGFYASDSIIFFGRSRIMFSDIKGKKSRYVDIKPGADSLNKLYSLPVAERNWFLLNGSSTTQDNGTRKKLLQEFDRISGANGLILTGVTVRTRAKTKIQELEDKYTSGAFSGEVYKTLDLTNKDETAAYQNIYQYIQDRVNGVSAFYDDQEGKWMVYYRQMPTISSLGNQTMDIFLDEVLTDATTVAAIPPSQIALVKVFGTFVGSTGGGSGGALAIYLKKGADYFESLPSAAETIVYNGYSVIREFYSPDYTLPVTTRDPDNRVTLYWKPDIHVSGVNQKIPLVFYNNDRTKNFKIVIEGVTADGKLLMMEKRFE